MPWWKRTKMRLMGALNKRSSKQKLARSSTHSPSGKQLLKRVAASATSWRQPRMIWIRWQELLGLRRELARPLQASQQVSKSQRINHWSLCRTMEVAAWVNNKMSLLLLHSHHLIIMKWTSLCQKKWRLKHRLHRLSSRQSWFGSTWLMRGKDKE